MKIFNFFTVSLLVVNLCYAQFGSSGMGDAKSVGLAGTYNSVSSGSFALGINPANIIMTDHSTDLLFVLPLPQLNFKTSIDFMTLQDFNYFFEGVDGEARYLTEEDKNRLNDLFEDGGQGAFSVAVNLLSFTFDFPAINGAVGFSINDVLAGNFVIPHSLIEFTTRGNPVNKIYSFSDTDFKSWWLRTYSLSYARELKEIESPGLEKITAGISLKLVHGYAYAGTANVYSYFNTGQKGEITGRAEYLVYTSFTNDLGVDYSFDDEETGETNMHPFPPPAGTGIGIDLGFSMAVQQNWNFSFAVTDIGTIRWKNKTARYLAEGDIIMDDASNHALRDSIVDMLSGDGSYVNGFITSLPMTMRTGVSYSFKNDDDGIPGNLVLALDYNQGFNNYPGNSTVPRVSYAAEWQPLNWSFIRTGFSFGGLDGFNWSAGLGFAFGLIELNFATSNITTITHPNTANKLSFAFNSRWRM